MVAHDRLPRLAARGVARLFGWRAVPDPTTFGRWLRRGGAALPELLDEVLVHGEPELAPQPEEGVTYADKIGPADRELDLSRPAAGLVDRVRALSPHIGARAVVDGRPLLVWKARVGDDGSLELLEVQPEGRRRMSYDEYLRGLR